MLICEKANVSCTEECGVEEIQKIEEAFEISIKIFDVNTFLNIIYSGPVSNETKAVIYIVRSDTEAGFHFDYITNISKFLGKRFFCDFCNFSYNAIHSHCCSDVNDWCYTCYDRNCERDFSFEKMKCEIC